MKFEVFNEVINNLKKHNIQQEAAYTAGVDLNDFLYPIHSTVSHLIGSIYGKEGKTTFEWWCYDKNWGTRKDIQMWDSSGNVVCETAEELWQWLEKNAVWDYDLKK